MASTYSDLKIELIGTGEQAGTWGATTNVNLGTALEEAIVGSADVAFSSTDVTLTLVNTNGTQTARNLRLNLTGTSGGARQLILGSGCQINKLYIINNGLADNVTVKNTTGTGVTVPAGRSMLVFNTGVNVVDVITQFNGNASTATTANTLTTARDIQTNLASTSAASFNGSANITPGVTGTLPVANGGTGQVSYTNGQLLIGNTTGNTLTKATLTAGTGVTVTNGTGSITLAIGQAVATSSDVEFNSLGVGTAGSATPGEIRATDNVTAYYSSDRKFKENVQDIETPLKKVVSIGGKTFDWTDEYLSARGGEDGYFIQKSDFGVIAQDVQAVFPVAVRTKSDGTLAVDYEKLCSLAFAAIKELEARVALLESK